MVVNLLKDLRSYYRGSRERDQREFYDLESRLPYFNQVNRILCRDKRRWILHFLKAGRGPEGDRVLEVGCGIGTFARFLARRGESVVGVDISRKKIIQARARAGWRRARSLPGRVEYHVGDLQELGSGGGLDRAVGGGRPLEFSRIVAADVLEHVPSPPLETVRRLSGLLAAGGRLIASVPSRLCLGDPGHIWRLVPEEWEQVFRSARLRILGRRMSRIYCYRLITPLPLAMVFSLEVEGRS
jgi:2-polyprenyl-3-methyl-5-hydroxy-6-metoxy-1,4-benzoquinol methylase